MMPFTLYGRLVIKPQLNLAAKYLISNWSRIKLAEYEQSAIRKLKTLADTPISIMFERFVLKHFDQYFAFDATRGDGAIPELILTDVFTIDGKHADVNIRLPSELQKVWFNIAPYVSKQKEFKILDPFMVMAAYVRGLLVMSYNDAITSGKSWMTPSFTGYLIDSYSMAISRILTRTYALEFDEEQYVRTAFAFFYATLVVEHAGAPAAVGLLGRIGSLGSPGEIQNRVNILLEKYKPESRDITLLCNAIAQTGISRMSKFNVSKLMSMFCSSSADNLYLSVAIDYPPYWAYLLLRHESGDKCIQIGNLYKLSTYNKAGGDWCLLTMRLPWTIHR